MIKNNKNKLLITSLIILLPLLAGLLLWDKFPEQVPIHWGISGEADGYGSRAMAVIGLPVFMLAVHWVCLLVTSIDPKNKNISGKPLAIVMWICPVMSVLTCSVIYAAALGHDVSVNSIVPAFLGLMFIIIGNYLPKCRHNYTLGIKLPWTLSDEANWNATHRFAGPVWVAGGALMIIGALLSQPWIIIVIAVVLIIVPTVYSYLYFKKH